MSARARGALLPLAIAFLGSACHHRLAPTATESDCGRSVFSSPLAPDSVAIHYLHAFEALGLDDAAWFSQADTAFATSIPTALPRDTSGARFGSRLVAYRRGDSTRYRTYVTIDAPSSRSAVRDSANPAVRRRTEDFCEELAQRAAVRGVRADPAPGESALPVWKLGRSPAVER